MVELDRTNANAFFNRGSTHDSLGAYDKAIADYTRALEMEGRAAGGAGADAGAQGGGA